ncbi:MAG: HPr(Ser) kinase/phosphatase [Oscillospiraceae bacterium]|nr:HPr(Ser) kinase/phosphatase [Oscillospiraceae bacterium]
MVYSIKLFNFAELLEIKPIFLSTDAESVAITTTEINRAGLILSGFMEHNNPDRVQVCGKAEMAYIQSLDNESSKDAMEHLFAMKPPAVVITTSLEPTAIVLEYAAKYDVSIYSSDESTSNFIAEAISHLSTELAPRITRHGVLVEVYGEGVLILGDSGIGKSETAIELVKRGHRLIADDAVELRKVSGRTIVGTSPENIRHYIELRGIGIINVRQIFGMGSVNISEKVNLVITLELWDPDKNYAKLGNEEELYDILGVKIPTITLPVKPGRNLAVIIEVAAMTNRQKSLGYDAAKELLDQLELSLHTPLDWNG